MDISAPAVAKKAQACLSSSIMFPYENGLLVIVRSADTVHIPPELTQMLEKYELRAGASMEFKDFLFIKYAYIQSKNALGQGRNEFSFFADCYSDCLMSTLGQVASLKS